MGKDCRYGRVTGASRADRKKVTALRLIARFLGFFEATDEGSPRRVLAI
jgi:hypothetical protein